MANAFQSIASGAATLKNFYEGPIVSQFNDDMPLYKGCEKGKEKWSGLQVVRPLKVLRNGGIGATSDGGPLPAIGRQTTIQALIVAKYNYLRAGITGPMLKASQGDKGAFISEMTYEMEQGLIDLKNDVNRQLFWDGRGDLAVLSANAVASPTITVTGRTASEDGSKYLDAGMVVDIVSTAGVVKASAVTIVSVTGTSTATVVLNAAVTAASGDIVVRSGAFNNEIQGILTQLDGQTTTVFNIDRATYQATRGNSVDALSAQMSLNLIQQTVNEARRRGGGKLSAVYSDFDSERFYHKLLIADKRYVQKDMEGDGTFSRKGEMYLSYMGAPWVADKDCPRATYFLMESALKKYVLAELEWADETGALMIAQTGADSFELRLRLFANLFNEKPNTCARLHSYISP